MNSDTYIRLKSFRSHAIASLYSYSPTSGRLLYYVGYNLCLPIDED